MDDTQIENTEEKVDEVIVDDETKKQQEELEKLRKHNESLADALVREEMINREREDLIRAKREANRDLKLKLEESSEEEDDDSDEGDAKKITEKVKREIQRDMQKQNLALAKSQFYRSNVGKVYDPLNDVTGKKWKEMTDFLNLSPNDVSVESILRKLTAAAYGHQQDRVEVSREQQDRNRQKAEEALSDLGSGGRGSVGKERMASIDDLKPTEQDKFDARRYGLTIEQWMASKKKLMRK